MDTGLYDDLEEVTTRMCCACIEALCAGQMKIAHIVALLQR